MVEVEDHLRFFVAHHTVVKDVAAQGLHILRRDPPGILQAFE